MKSIELDDEMTKCVSTASFANLFNFFLLLKITTFI